MRIPSLGSACPPRGGWAAPPSPPLPARLASRGWDPRAFLPALRRLPRGEGASRPRLPGGDWQAGQTGAAAVTGRSNLGCTVGPLQTAFLLPWPLRRELTRPHGARGRSPAPRGLGHRPRHRPPTFQGKARSTVSPSCRPEMSVHSRGPSLHQPLALGGPSREGVSGPHASPRARESRPRGDRGRFS